jgi:rare lipoprotein A
VFDGALVNWILSDYLFRVRALQETGFFTHPFGSNDEHRAIMGKFKSIRIERFNLVHKVVGLVSLLTFYGGCATTSTNVAPRAAPVPAAPAVYVPPSPPPLTTSESESAASHIETKRAKVVKASYQSTVTAGRPTSSGEPYNPNALTAASKTLPIGSVVKVTNPSTGEAVKVRINDRGPFVPGRSIDLSKRAAREIGITKKGVSKVVVAPVSSHTSESSHPEASSTFNPENSPSGEASPSGAVSSNAPTESAAEQ